MCIKVLIPKTYLVPMEGGQRNVNSEVAWISYRSGKSVVSSPMLFKRIKQF